MSLQDLRDRFPWPDVPRVKEDLHGFGIHQHFSSLLPDRENLVIVEIGVWLGRNILHLAGLRPSATIIAIDHWLGSPEHSERLEWKKRLPKLYEKFCANVWHIRDRVIPVRLSSSDGLQLCRELGIQADVVYIDAGHEYQDVLEDCENCFLTFPSALICGDDFQSSEVSRAVLDVGAEKGKTVRTAGRLWWYA